ncbi:endo-1,4-beta-xylanase [Nostoc cycadae]|nr:endo-1,4-beta-xylanase [Nostoc cycadae]
MMKRPTLIDRRSFLFGLGSLATVGTVVAGKVTYENQQIQALDTNNRDFSVTEKPSLHERAAKKGLIYGAAVRTDILKSDAKYAATVIENCRMLVPEWEMKWAAGNVKLRPSPDKFDFAPADWLANFATSHDLLLRGHTLVWHRSLPSWFKEKANSKNAVELLKNHINTVVKRYAGKIHSWDVVNEVMLPKDGRSDGLRISPWLELLGQNYIELAFRLTSAADPNALLVYNEYDLDYDNRQQEAKRIAVLKLLERLRTKGTPIHALGIQAHLSPGDNQFNAKKLRKFLQDVASLGLKIMITELDVVDKKLPFDIQTRDRIIAGVYEDYLSTVLDERAVIAVLTWGLSDRYSWLNEFEPRSDKAPVRPLPYDTYMQRKLAWNAIARAFDQAPKR